MMSRFVLEAAVLVVDDEESWLDSISTVLQLTGIRQVTVCSDPRNVLGLLQQRHFDVILLDLWMPHISGDQLLEEIRLQYPDVSVIMVTAANNVEMAVKCIQRGATNYVIKPVVTSQLIAMVHQSLLLRSARHECDALREKILQENLKNAKAFKHIITASRSMNVLFQYIEAVAHSNEPVLITGETGSGKELIAGAIHAASNRTGDFIPVNIAGLDDSAFSDTLFGHKRGAFTGAVQSRAGLIEAAGNGTLLLDEIGDLPPCSQVKLLRLLQEHEYLPLGADVAKFSRARIIVATHKDLGVLQEEGTFRKDLYFRLRTHHVHVPPLRDRRNDIPLLLHTFLEKACKALGKELPTVPTDLLNMLMRYSFPGNVRELRSIVFDAVSCHENGDLPLEPILKAMRINGVSLSDHGSHDEVPYTGPSFVSQQTLPSLKQAQEELITEALRRAHGNQATAARLLGITPQAMSQRLKRRK